MRLLWCVVATALLLSVAPVGVRSVESDDPFSMFEADEYDDERAAPQGSSRTRDIGKRGGQQSGEEEGDEDETYAFDFGEEEEEYYDDEEEEEPVKRGSRAPVPSRRGSDGGQDDDEEGEEDFAFSFGDDDDEVDEEEQQEEQEGSQATSRLAGRGRRDGEEEEEEEEEEYAFPFEDDEADDEGGESTESKTKKNEVLDSMFDDVGGEEEDGDSSMDDMFELEDDEEEEGDGQTRQRGRGLSSRDDNGNDDDEMERRRAAQEMEEEEEEDYQRQGGYQGTNGRFKGKCPAGCECLTDDDIGCAVSVSCVGLSAMPTSYDPRIDCVSIESSPKLRHLSLEEKRAGFRALPTALRYLSLFQARLHPLPDDALSHLVNVRFLNLEGNNLVTLPETLFDGLTKLKTMYLTGAHFLPHEEGYRLNKDSENRIRSLHENQFKDLTNLQVLLIHHNQLTSLPDNLFRSQAKLRVLKLLDNKLKVRKSDRVFAPLGSIEQLDLKKDSGDQLEDDWNYSGDALSD